MDQIYKLQPHRTMHLQGFDDYGAAASALESDIAALREFHELCRPTKPTEQE